MRLAEQLLFRHRQRLGQFIVFRRLGRGIDIKETEGSFIVGVEAFDVGIELRLVVDRRLFDEGLAIRFNDAFLRVGDIAHGHGEGQAVSVVGRVGGTRLGSRQQSRQAYDNGKPVSPHNIPSLILRWPCYVMGATYHTPE